MLFDCLPEQVVLTTSATHGLNIAIKDLVRAGDRVVISGFEHNAVVRPLYAIGAEVCVAGTSVIKYVIYNLNYEVHVAVSHMHFFSC